MKSVYFILVLILLSSSVLAADLEVKKIDRGSVVIAELNNPAVFDFVIDNRGEADRFEIYSLIGVAMAPKGLFELPHGKTTMRVWAWPNEDIRKERGLLKFEYQMKGRNSGIFKDDLLIKIVPFKEIIEIGAESLHPDDDAVVLTVKNKENTHLENLKIEFDSVLFSGEEVISLEPYETVNLSVDVKKELEGIAAGTYIVKADFQMKEEKASIEGVVKYLEKEGTFSEESSEGFIVRKSVLRKVNEGNVPVTALIEVKRNIMSRLFTVNSPEPLSVERKGLFVDYTWEKNLAPGEDFVVETTTNYTFPFIFLVIIVLAGILVKVYSLKAVVLKKSVSFVRTKHGEFALKVSLRVRARKAVENVHIVDTLPGMTKLYEGYGRKPDKVDKDSRRLFWNVERLSKGEVRIYSYIIYSKLNVVGRFELPAAVAVFEDAGKRERVKSNRAFFASEKS